MNVHNIRLLTIGGKYIWEESGDINDILSSNDIYHKNTILSDNIHLCEVDIEKTNINDMYKWSDIHMNTDTFCWRDYVFFIGKKNEHWLHHPKNEKIGKIYVNDFLKLIGI